MSNAVSRLNKCRTSVHWDDWSFLNCQITVIKFFTYPIVINRKWTKIQATRTVSKWSQNSSVLTSNLKHKGPNVERDNFPRNKWVGNLSRWTYFAQISWIFDISRISFSNLGTKCPLPLCVETGYIYTTNNSKFLHLSHVHLLRYRFEINR